MSEAPSFGARIRALRRREGLSQARLAERLEISPSYLNLIENNRRPLSAPLLIKLAQTFDVELQSFATDADSRLVADLMEALGDPLFERHELSATEVREMATASPGVARAILTLYHAWEGARQSMDSLADQLTEGDEPQSRHASRLSSEEVSDLIQRRLNYFPEIEAAAESFRRDAHLDEQDLYEGLVRHLEGEHGIQVRMEKVHTTRGAVRRFDPKKKLVLLSEILRRGSRNFQLAHVVGLLTQGKTFDRVAQDPILTSDESRALSRVALANYFASAVLMPYQGFLDAARAERYDIEVLGHRFRTSLEQVCHRLTTLRRPGAEGVPFHMVRTDVAGNVSKRFSGSGIRFARFSGGCPRWNIFAAFMTPGRFRVQVSRMPDGTAYFSLARTLSKESSGYQAQLSMQAIELGCELRHAGELVYADGVDLKNLNAAVPIGVTCRLCERMDCEQRAFPSLAHPLRVDENVRGISFYAPTEAAAPEMRRPGRRSTDRPK